MRALGNAKKVGSGHLSVVYALDQNPDIILKVPKNDQDNFALQLFSLEQRYAERVAQISAQWVPKIIEIIHDKIKVELDGETMEHGRGGILMEKIDGRSLITILKTEISPWLIAFYGLQILTAISNMHRHGIVHRDIKPDNIMILRENTQLKLIDFGYTIAIDDPTETNYAVGSPGYIPPQAHKSRKRDPQNDLYSIGSTLFWLASGRSPHYADSWAEEKLFWAMNPTFHPDPPKDIGPLGNIIKKLMAPESTQRYQSAEEAIEELKPICLALTNSDQRKIDSMKSITAKSLLTA